MTIETNGQQHLFEVQAYLDDLDPDMVRVELYSDGSDNPERHEMARLRPLLGTTGGYAYRAAVPATRPAADYTPRIIPRVPVRPCRSRRPKSFGSGERLQTNTLTEQAEIEYNEDTNWRR